MSIDAVSDSMMQLLRQHSAAHAKAYLDALRVMDSDARLNQFLRRCNQQGIHNRRVRYPTHTELGVWCGCNASTIGRIASRQTQNVSRDTLKLLNAIAGICPHAEIGDGLHAEIMCRVQDAKDRSHFGMGTTDEVLAAVLDGIQLRLDEAAEDAIDQAAAARLISD